MAVQVKTAAGVEFLVQQRSIERSLAGLDVGLDPIRIEKWLRENLDDAGVFAAIDGGQILGLSILEDVDGTFSPGVWVQLFWAGEPSAREPLLNAMAEWLDERGIEKVRIVNASGHSDEAHMRLFRSHAAGRAIGGLIEYEVSDGGR